MKTLLGYIAAFVLLTVAGCGHSYPPSLRLADSLMDSRPDSALAVLDAARGQTVGAPEAVRMRYQLLRHQAMNKAFVPFTTDSVMRAVADYYDRHGTANDRLLAHYLLGCVYRDLGEAPKAIAAYHEAAEQADICTPGCDFALLSRVHGQAAALMEKLQLPDEALVETKKAEHYATIAGDTMAAIANYAYQSTLYYLMGDMDSVLNISIGSSIRILQHGDTLLSLLYSLPAITAYISLDSLQQAGELLRRYQMVHHRYESENFTRGMLGDDFVVIGEYYRKKGMLDSAKFYYNLVYPESPNTTLLLYRELAHYFAAVGNTDSALFYADSYVAMDDTVYRESVRRDFQKMNAIYNYEHSERREAQKSLELMQTRRLAVVVTLFLFVSFITVVVIIIRRKHRLSSLLNLLNTRYADSLREYDDAMAQLHQLQDKLAVNQEILQAIQQKSDEHEELTKRLQGELAYMAIDISSKEEEIERLKKTISDFQDDGAPPEEWDLNSDVLKHPVVLRLRERIKSGRRPTDQEFSEIREVVDHYYPQFVPKLKALYPEISVENVFFCMFVKLRFIPSELCVIFRLTSQAVSNRRRNLCKMLFKSRSGAKEFDYNIRKLG